MSIFIEAQKVSFSFVFSIFLSLSGRFSLGQTCTVTNPASGTLSSGTIACISAASSGSYTINGGTLKFCGGSTINFSGSLTVNSGTLIIAEQTQVNVTGSISVTTNGEFQMSGGSEAVFAGGQLTFNKQTATMIENIEYIGDGSCDAVIDLNGKISAIAQSRRPVSPFDYVPVSTSSKINICGSWTILIGGSGSAGSACANTACSSSSLCNPLPIELKEFTAVRNMNGVSFSWTTLTEKNNDYFTVQRSNNSIEWNDVLRVDGAGNSKHEIEYSSFDPNPSTNTTYYRLKQTDFDGSFSYSGVKSVSAIEDHDVIILNDPTSRTLKLMAADNAIYTNYSLLSLKGIEIATGDIVPGKTMVLDKPSGQSIIKLISTSSVKNQLVIGE